MVYFLAYIFVFALLYTSTFSQTLSEAI